MRGRTETIRRMTAASSRIESRSHCAGPKQSTVAESGGARPAQSSRCAGHDGQAKGGPPCERASPPPLVRWRSPFPVRRRRSRAESSTSPSSTPRAVRRRCSFRRRGELLLIDTGYRGGRPRRQAHRRGSAARRVEADRLCRDQPLARGPCRRPRSARQADPDRPLLRSRRRRRAGEPAAPRRLQGGGRQTSAPSSSPATRFRSRASTPSWSRPT